MDDPSRSRQFPYSLQVTNGPNGSNNVLRTNRLKVYKQSPIYHETPTTYMVVNFDQPFQDTSLAIEHPELRKVNGDRMMATVDKFNDNIPPDRLPSLKTIPKLQSSYKLPVKNDPAIAVPRNMFNRHDQGSQTEMNLRRSQIEGLSNYQKWSSEVVEPFFKVCAQAC